MMATVIPVQAVWSLETMRNGHRKPGLGVPPGSKRGSRFATCLLVFVLASGINALAAAPLPFTLHDNSGDVHGPTLLIIGGIQGDEPGGFNAASLLVTHYEIERGRLWVVPNLNFESIIKRSRGVHGDMNRKFPVVSPKDPDYKNVERIKDIITKTEVDYVFNLHDGSGFYTPHRVDSQRNPRRWGQSIIIDQESMDRSPYAPLGGLARRVGDIVNSRLVAPGHRISVKNTHTREGNREMSKTLTYFAINAGKPAVGLEASKSLPTHVRVFYHLSMIEAYMQAFGIDYSRRFDLEPDSVRRAVDANVRVAFYDRRLFLDMSRARRTLGYVPLKKGAVLEYEASSPLVAILGAKDGYRVSYGNRRITRLAPQFFEYDYGLSEVAIRVDGKLHHVTPGSEVLVEQHFSVEPPTDYRVNVIGWTQRGLSNEAFVEVRRSQILERYSVDMDATTFRVELYKGKKFAGMILVRFAGPAPGTDAGDASAVPPLALNR